MQAQEIVIIDGKIKADGLADRLREAGFACHCVRGPLRLHELMAAIEVALILWRDAAINPALGRDLFQVMKFRPAIPIIHLYSQKTAAPSLPPGLNPADALPDANPHTELFKFLESSISKVEGGANTEEIVHTELAFHHIFSRLSNSPAHPLTDRPDRKQRGGFLPAGTALNPSERKLLTHRSEPDPTRMATFSYFSLLSRVTKRISAFKSR